MKDEKFDTWALLELMGRQRIAGKVTEHVIAGTGFLRCDVPETKSNPAFTRFIAPSSIYAINPITEDVAVTYAENLNAKPIDSWDLSAFMQKAEQRRLEIAAANQNDLPEEQEEEEEEQDN